MGICDQIEIGRYSIGLGKAPKAQEILPRASPAQSYIQLTRYVFLCDIRIKLVPQVLLSIRRPQFSKAKNITKHY